jgi:choline kinase
MKVIILSAGQGRRLRPLTDDTPKCLLPVRGSEPMLEVQLRALALAGIDEACVVTGFGAARIESYLAARPADAIRVTTVFNPLYAVSDNLATCWLARDLMHDEFMILNGDTLFEPAVARRLLRAPDAPLALAINEKPEYDDDDMKVSLKEGSRLVAVGKTLDPRIVDGESIGFMRFGPDGSRGFREILERVIREPDAMTRWYLSAVNELAQTQRVSALPITGLWWGELDSPADLACLRAALDDDAKPLGRVQRALFARA